LKNALLALALFFAATAVFAAVNFGVVGAYQRNLKPLKDKVETARPTLVPTVPASTATGTFLPTGTSTATPSATLVPSGTSTHTVSSTQSSTAHGHSHPFRYPDSHSHAQHH
jgi:hypothetical protein